MEIEFNPSHPAGSSASQPAAGNRPAMLQPEPMSLGNAEALKAAVNNLPLSRSEQVDRASALVSDAAYPPEEILNAVAGLLAKNIQ
jgi:hypothetical protein